MFRRWRRPQTFHLVFEEPTGETAARRMQRFAGFVQSDRPVPPFRVLLDGAEQPIACWNLGDPKAPADRRHTAYFTFHREIAAWNTCIALDVRAGDRTIGHRTFVRDGPDDRTDRPLLCLMHIPKTAGTSLRLALELHRDIRLLRLYNDRAFLPIAACATLSPAAFDDLDVVFGHFDYGLHAHAHRPCRYMTVLRHPADLLRSIYLFNKYVARTELFVRSASIGEAFAALVAQDNSFTRMISGRRSPAPVGADDLARAMTNIDTHFAYIGCVDDMDATRRVVGDYLGFELQPFEINMTPPTPESRADVREELLARCGRFMEHDMRLYDYARTLFASGARE